MVGVADPADTRIFELSADGFDLFSADPELLRRYGFRSAGSRARTQLGGCFRARVLPVPTPSHVGGSLGIRAEVNV